MEERSKTEERRQFAFLYRADLKEKVLFAQKLEGSKGDSLADVLYPGEEHSSRENKQYAPKMGGLGTI